MQINTAQLLKEAIGSSRSYDINNALSFTEDEEIEECYIKGKVKLIRTDKGILVQGMLTGKGNLICSRCLTPYEYPFSFRIEDEFFPSNNIVNGSSLSLPDDPTTLTIDEHHILDLSEAFRQYAILTIPMKPLCYADCAGLCSNCGANLNQNTCSCAKNSEATLLGNLLRKVK